MKNLQSTFSYKNQVVVPALIRRALKLKPGDMLNWRLMTTSRTPKAVTEPLPKNWTSHAQGLGQDLWQDINLDTYINALREEWQLQKHLVR